MDCKCLALYNRQLFVVFNLGDPNPRENWLLKNAGFGDNPKEFVIICNIAKPTDSYYYWTTDTWTQRIEAHMIGNLPGDGKGQIKLLEIRDNATFIPAFAFKFPDGTVFVGALSDPHRSFIKAEPTDRTYYGALNYLHFEWDTIVSGQVLDVRVWFEEQGEPVLSEQITRYQKVDGGS